jgi:hypothetical protein
MAGVKRKKTPVVSEFENGWRVLVRIPAWTVAKEAIVVGQPCRLGRKYDYHNRIWIWVAVEGKRLQVPEDFIKAKEDESYCAEFVKDLQTATLVRNRVKDRHNDDNNDAYIERERIKTPTNKKGFLKLLRCGGWSKITGFRARLLDETYKRLTTQAASAGV